MKNVGKIVGINLLVLVVYSLVIHFSNKGSDRGLGILIESAFAVGLHVFISLGITIANFNNDKKLGRAWLLSTGVVLLVGFSTCLGSAAV